MDIIICVNRFSLIRTRHTIFSTLNAAFTNCRKKIILSVIHNDVGEEAMHIRIKSFGKIVCFSYTVMRKYFSLFTINSSDFEIPKVQFPYLFTNYNKIKREID